MKVIVLLLSILVAGCCVQLKEENKQLKEKVSQQEITLKQMEQVINHFTGKELRNGE